MNIKGVNPEDSLIASKISETLSEKEIELIQAVVHIKGPDYALSILEKVKKILEEGGALKKNGEKRAPGGIFFQLVKNTSSKPESDLIFKPHTAERRRRSRLRRQLEKHLNSLSL